MKKLFIILGGIFLTIVIVFIAGFVYLGISGRSLDEDSKKYVDVAIPAIVSTWDKQALIDHASPELMTVVNSNDLDKMINMSSHKLGKLKEYKGANGQANISLTPQKGKVITAVYVGKAEFESGPAELKVDLIQHDGKWQILGFYINSKVFLQNE